MGILNWMAASSIGGSIIDQNSWTIECMSGQNLVRDSVFEFIFCFRRERAFRMGLLPAYSQHLSQSRSLHRWIRSPFANAPHEHLRCGFGRRNRNPRLFAEAARG